MKFWKTVEDFPNYRISSEGNLISLFYGKETLRVPSKNKGYLQAVMCGGVLQDRKYCSIHRLVAEAFIPNPDSLPEVNHIDGNKWNNTVENLEWVTEKQNSEHACRTGLTPALKGTKNGNSKLTEKSVKDLRAKRSEGWTYVELSKYFEIDKSTVLSACRNKTWKHV